MAEKTWEQEVAEAADAQPPPSWLDQIGDPRIFSAGADAANFTQPGAPEPSKPWEQEVAEAAPKSWEQEVAETPTQGMVPDFLKRAARSGANIPALIDEGLGSSLDAMERTVRGTAAMIATPDPLDKLDAFKQTWNSPIERYAPAVEGLHDAGQAWRDFVKEGYTGDFAPDPARDHEIQAQIADAAGPVAAAFLTPGGAVAKTVTGAIVNARFAADAAEEKLKAQGASDDEIRTEAARQFVFNLPVGAIEHLPWSEFLGRYGSALEDAVAERWGKTTAQRLLKATTTQAGKGALAGVTQQAGQNITAALTYDPERDLTQGLKEQAFVGGILGGTTAAGAQGFAELAAPTADTGRNLPETMASLMAQRKQLVAGDRAAVMYPTGTQELKLPNGMERIETPRGIFHYDPDQISAQQIQNLSAQGKENLILGLGQYDKGDIAARMAAGEPAASLVERDENGNELRTAAVTPSTLPGTAATMNAGKSDGSTLNLESVTDTLRQRQGAPQSVEEMLAAEAASKQARLAAAQQAEADRQARLQAAAEKRAAFDSHLSNAADVTARGEAETPSASVAEVTGSANVLRNYLEDNSIGLTVDQRQKARAILDRLEPVETTLRAQAETERDARTAQARADWQAQQDAMAAKIKADRASVNAQRDIDPATGKKRLDRMTEDELVAEAQAGNKQAERLLELGGQQQEGKGDDLLSVLKLVKLPASNEMMRGELAKIKDEGVSFGLRQQLFSDKPGSLDLKAEQLRTEYGFDDITGPNELIDHVERALRGEKIMPTWREGTGQVSFARAEGPPAERFTNPQQAMEWLTRRFNLTDAAIREMFGENNDVVVIANEMRDYARTRGEAAQGKPPPPPPGYEADQQRQHDIEDARDLEEPTARPTPEVYFTDPKRALEWLANYFNTSEDAVRAKYKMPVDEGYNELANYILSQPSPTHEGYAPATHEPFTDPAKAIDWLTTQFNISDQALFESYGHKHGPSYVELANRIRAGQPLSGEALAQNLQMMADRNPESFKLKKTRAKDAATIAEAMSPPGQKIHGREGGMKGIVTFWGMAPDNERASKIVLHHRGGNTWEADATEAYPLGTPLYQSALSWIHNNGKHLKGYILSDINILRRTSQMLSSALRFGTTEHLLPAPEQGLAWVRGEHAHNIANMARREAAIVLQTVPEVRGWHYDIPTGKILDQNGAEITPAVAARAAEKAGSFEEHGIGPTTIKRALLSLALDGRSPAEVSKALAHYAGQAGEKSPVFYARGEGLTPEAGRPVAAPKDAAALDDMEARFARIAPGLAMRYRLLVGGPEALAQLGVRPEQLTGTEQAAHDARREAIWLLEQNARADKDGKMPERTRRDLLHETAHAWMESLPPETKAELQQRFEEDRQDPNGWLAEQRANKVQLREGVGTDWREYWAERLAHENHDWANRREGSIAGNRGFVGQLAYDFRTWIQEGLAYLRDAYSHSKRYNVDFRAFLNDPRFATEEAPARQPGTEAAPQSARGYARTAGQAQGTLDLGTPLGLQLPPTVKNLSPKWQEKTLDFQSSLDKALYYAGGENTENRASLVRTIADQTGLSSGQVATLARRLRERLRPLTEGTAPQGTLRVEPLMQPEVQQLTGVEFAKAEQSPEERRQAIVQQFNEVTKRIGKATGQRAIKNLQGQRSDLRTQLDSEFPDWRKIHPENSDGTRKLTPPPAAAAGTTAPAEATAAATPPPEGGPAAPPEGEAPPAQGPLPEDTERAQTPLPAPEFTPRPGIYDRVEGQSSTREPWIPKQWEKVKNYFQGFRGPIPELPAYADEKTQQFRRLRQFNQLIKRGTGRVYKEAADAVGAIVEPLLKAAPVNADAHAELAKLQARRRALEDDGRPVSPALAEDIAALNRKTEAEPYTLFQRLALYLDLKWRVENLKDDQGNPITQPGHMNVQEINARLDELKAQLEASPHRALILEALQKSRALTKSIAADLRARDLNVPEDLENPFYFPHVILNEGETALDRVRLSTAEDFRGYLMNPVGSAKPIETDFSKAMYYHLAAVGSHNLRSDLTRDYLKPYDQMQAVKDKAKELSKQYGRPVSWREAYATKYANQGYSLFHPDDRLPMHPEMTINRDTLARRLGVTLTDEPLQKQLEALGLKGIKILPQDIHEGLASGERETWVLPEKVKEALQGMLDREQSKAAPEDPWQKIGSLPVRLWKNWTLFAPQNHLRYEYNNSVADLEKMFSADPRVLKLLPSAAKEVREFIENGKGGNDVKQAFKLGVLDSITANEVNDLPALREFERLKTTKGKISEQVLKRLSSIIYQPALAGAALATRNPELITRARSTTDISRLREATVRYAKFKADLERMRNGARPVYAGAYWRDIEAIQDSQPGANDAHYHKAAEISLATFGDHHNLSVAGGNVKKYLMPFYSWLEVNFKYHQNLFRNAADMIAHGEMSRGEAAGQGARAAASMASTFGRKAAGAFVTRLALPYAAMLLWNNSGGRRQLEDDLSEEDRRRFHIVLGRDAKGRAMVVYGATALADVAKWFGGPIAGQKAVDVLMGRTNAGTAFSDFLKQYPTDLLNTAAGGLGPHTKALYTLASGKSTFPDITDQRTIPSYDLKWNILSQMTDQFTADMIRRAADKDYLSPKDMGDWAQQAILQVRKRDPLSWSFYTIKDKAAQWIADKKGLPKEEPSPSEQLNAEVLRNFKKSIYQGDVQNAMRFYDRLLEMGYTAEQFRSSIRAQDPLNDIPTANRREFVQSLSPFERDQLAKAYEYYNRMAEEKGAERTLFPSQRIPEQQRGRFVPQHGRLQQELQNQSSLEDLARQQQAQQQELRSMRPTGTGRH